MELTNKVCGTATTLVGAAAGSQLTNFANQAAARIQGYYERLGIEKDDVMKWAYEQSEAKYHLIKNKLDDITQADGTFSKLGEIVTPYWEHIRNAEGINETASACVDVTNAYIGQMNEILHTLLGFDFSIPTDLESANHVAAGAATGLTLYTANRIRKAFKNRAKK